MTDGHSYKKVFRVHTVYDTNFFQFHVKKQVLLYFCVSALLINLYNSVLITPDSASGAVVQVQISACFPERTKYLKYRHDTCITQNKKLK